MVGITILASYGKIVLLYDLDVTMYCLNMLIDKLRPRRKLTRDPLDALICFAPVSEGRGISFSLKA